MMLTLDNFEEEIPKKIIDRGFDYYADGNIQNIEQLDKGEFAAAVSGSVEYNVFVKINGQKIEEWSCTCPYDWGDVCKHTVAVFFYLRNVKVSNKEIDNSHFQQIKATLKAVKKADLAAFVLEYAKTDHAFRQKLNLLSNRLKD